MGSTPREGDQERGGGSWVPERPQPTTGSSEVEGSPRNCPKLWCEVWTFILQHGPGTGSGLSSRRGMTLSLGWGTRLGTSLFGSLLLSLYSSLFSALPSSQNR